MEQLDDKSYDEEFRVEKVQDSLRETALNLALDIRRFEIDLYWKRAAYFWTFIGASLVGYGIAQGLDDPEKSDLSVVVSCLGLAFSFVWYCVNQGSKMW